MNSHRAVIIAILFILILLGIWGLSFYFGGGTPLKQENAAGVVLTHSKLDNEHIYSGEVMMSAPCDVVSSDLSVAYSKPPRAKIALMISRPKGAVCASRKSPADFSVSFMSKEMPQISLTIDGKEVPVSVVEK